MRSLGTCVWIGVVLVTAQCGCGATCGQEVLGSATATAIRVELNGGALEDMKPYSAQPPTAGIEVMASPREGKGVLITCTAVADGLYRSGTFPLAEFCTELSVTDLATADGVKMSPSGRLEGTVQVSGTRTSGAARVNLPLTHLVAADGAHGATLELVDLVYSWDEITVQCGGGGIPIG